MIVGVKVGEEGFGFMGVRLYSKGMLSERLLVWLHSDISVVDVVGEGVGSGEVTPYQKSTRFLLFQNPVKSSTVYSTPFNLF